MHTLRRIEARIAELRAAKLWREPDHGVGVAEGIGALGGELSAADEAAGAGALDTRSNDYLGLARLPVSRETLDSFARLGAGSGGSRLVSGTTGAHRELERELAGWLRCEAALFFSSAFAANSGAIAALAGPGDLILSDALNHASLVDGCRLSRARVQVLPHLDLGALEQALRQPFESCWVVTESYFGMDAHVADLRRIAELCEAYGAGLLVDEAHAIGVFGPEGRGFCAEAGVVPDVVSGGLGKAFGLEGGFVACSAQLAGWLWNRARPFVFSTAPSPLICRAARERLLLVRSADSARAQLAALEQGLEEELSRLGIPVPWGRRGPIFPVVLGDPARALNVALELRQQGFLVQPIRPPTVPAGSSRLRINLRADMSVDDVKRLANALSRALGSPDAERRLDIPGAHRSLGTEPPPAGLEPAEPRRAFGPAAVRSKPEPAKGTSVSDGPGARPFGAWVVLGTGTGVGKTYVAEGLLRLLAAEGRAAAGLKPVETGIVGDPASDACDAARLRRASFHVKHPTPHPLYALPDPVAPSLAARRRGQAIDLALISEWLRQTRSLGGALPGGAAHDGPAPGGALTCVIETAGGVFSPLSSTTTNFDLARLAEPGHWVLVAPDRLGVLHDVGACWTAMRALGRTPDFVVLSAPATVDASTGSNAAELATLGLTVPIVALPRGDWTPLARLLSSPPPPLPPSPPGDPG